VLTALRSSSSTRSRSPGIVDRDRSGFVATRPR
jgi:hypothetical protein